MIRKLNARVLGIVIAVLLGLGSVYAAMLALRGDDLMSWSQQQAARPDNNAQAATATKAAKATGDTSATAKASQTLAALTSELSQPPARALAFDIARITPGATSVLAGRARPGQVVDVLADGVAVGTATADENGAWVLVIGSWPARSDAKLELRPSVAVAARREPTSEPRTSSNVRPAPTQLASVREPTAAGRTDVPSTNAAMMQRLETLISEARQSSRRGSSATVEQVAEATKPPAVIATPAATTPATDGARTKVAALDRKPEPAGHAVVPVPIQFEFQTAEFTPFGQQAAKKLLEFLKVSRQSAVSLSGHADDRGSEAYNFELSRKRLQTVQAFLRAGGYTGELKLQPMGKSQPFRGIDRSKLSADELYQLDRRVELRIAN